MASELALAAIIDSSVFYLARNLASFGMQQFRTLGVTVFWLLALEVLFFVPDVTGSAWASGKTVGNLSSGVLFGATMLFFASAYVAKSLLQRRFQSMLLLDIAMALVSNAAAAFADMEIFHRNVNVPGLAVATIGLLIMTTSVSQLEVARPGRVAARQKKYYVDVMIWMALIAILPGLSLERLVAQTGLSMAVAVPIMAFVASLFSKTGSNLQKQAFQKRAASTDNKSLIEGVFTHPRYIRGLLGNLASQILLAHISVQAGIAGVSVLRAFFSFGISTALSLKEEDIVLEGAWGLAALCGFVMFLVSRLL